MNKIVNGEEVEIPANEAAEIQAKWNDADIEQAANQYKQDRATEYPSTETQLDMIYLDKVNNTSEWQTLIASIKAKYPKP